MKRMCSLTARHSWSLLLLTLSPRVPFSLTCHQAPSGCLLLARLGASLSRPSVGCCGSRLFSPQPADHQEEEGWGREFCGTEGSAAAWYACGPCWHDSLSVGPSPSDPASCSCVPGRQQMMTPIRSPCHLVEDLVTVSGCWHQSGLKLAEDLRSEQRMQGFCVFPFPTPTLEIDENK